MPSTTIQQRRVQGSFTSGSFVVPNEPGNVLRIAADIKASDLIDPLLSMELRLYVFEPADGLWHFVGGGGWKGFPTNTGQPIIEIPLIPLVGKTVRGEIDIPNQMTVGATIETGPTIIPPD